MQPGQASKTAVMVCMARAMADGSTAVPGFSDPTALTLLPAESRAKVERFKSGEAARSRKGEMERAFVAARATMMAVRTVAIDDAVRGAASPQVVILGAGLDGRAWRMAELRDAVVFEVDHPDSQRDKRARVGTLTQAAREVRFVAVDFGRDSLDDALAAAGHDPAQPTTWIWEGVVMYLRPSEVEASLAVIDKRSAAGSRLIVAYGAQTLMWRFVGLFLRWLGEPLRSAYTADEMRALLAKYRFGVLSDSNLPELGAAYSAQIGHETRFMKHLRIATADRLAAGA
jgi:methyltransferase (TIGR00027 family)